MLNRRLIRVKVLQAVYAYHQTEIKDIRTTKSFLRKSINGIEDTFHSILQFPDDLFHFVNTSHNPADKHIKVDQEKELTFQFLSSNQCLNALLTEPKSKDLFAKPSYKWGKDSDFISLIYKQIIETDWFQKCVSDPNRDFKSSKEFLITLYQYLIESSDDFNIKMEEINLHWQDEKIPVLKSIEKLLKSFTDDISTLSIPPISKDLADDLEFSEQLLILTVNNHTEYETLISQRTPDWDSERIARIDLYIMVMALAEFLDFPNIPVKVTINEYLELAKLYSTPQSSKFINGILDKLLNELKTEGKIKKQGRGLVE